MLESLFEIGSPVFHDFLAFIRQAKEHDNQFSVQMKEALDRWQDVLANMYDRSHLTEDFFLQHAFLVLVSSTILSRAGTSIENIPVLTVESFASCFSWLSQVQEPRQAIVSFVEGIDLPHHDIFFKIYPLVVSYSTKHGTGEYYTPVALARLMVKDTFVPGMHVMDPSCGSGTFLAEMINAILESNLDNNARSRAITALVGVDKNPLAIFMTTVNLMLILAGAGMKYAFPSIILTDTLFPNPPKVLPCNLDLIIGNPPWIVLGGVENASYKEHLKQLAIDLDIYMGGKNASNLEIASLFMFKLLENLEPGKEMFFILPNSLITGSQHDRARIFKGFESVRAWKFSRQPFKIHSTCLAGKKSRDLVPFNYTFPFTTIEVSEGVDGEKIFSKAGDEAYEPYTMKSSGDSRDVVSVGRLIPSSKKKRILPRKKSPYAKLFYKGAQIFPRTMFFVDILEKTIDNDCKIAAITPCSRVTPKKLGRWNFFPYQEDRVESSYLFKVAKSTFIVPFKLVETLDAFLPYKIIQAASGPAIAKDDAMLPNAARHMQVLESSFAAHLKPGAAHTSLFDIINYQNCLVNPRQMAPLKVAYNGGGSIVKGVIVEGQVIVDYSMFYFPVNDRDEANYLLGYLNAPVVTESVKMIGSTGFHGSLRNIVKHPLDFPWPRYDEHNADHVEVARLAKTLESRVNAIMIESGTTTINETDDEATRMKLQHLVFGDDAVNEQLEALDDLVRNIVEIEAIDLP